MKKRWTALALGAAAVAVGAALFRGPSLPALAPFVTIHSGGRVAEVALSPDGRFLADDAVFSGRVILYDTATGQQSHALPVRTRLLIFSPDGRRLLTENTCATPSSPVGNMQVWDTATGAQLSQFVAPMTRASQVRGWGPGIAAISRDLRWTVVDEAAGYAVYDTATGSIVKALPLPPGRSLAVFSPDRGLLAISSGTSETLQIWDTQTWRPVRMLGGPVSLVTGIRFSPDGSRLALGSKAGLAWWDTRAWKRDRRFAFPNPYGLTRDSFSFSSDGRSLLVSEVEPASGMHQVDCNTGSETLRVPSQKLQHVSILGDRAEAEILPTNWNVLSPDKRTTYCIWDTARKKPCYRIAIPPSANPPPVGDFQVHSNDLSADGHAFAAGGFDDGIIRVWRLP